MLAQGKLIQAHIHTNIGIFKHQQIFAMFNNKTLHDTKQDITC